MKLQHIIKDLQDAARQLGFEVRVETGIFHGGRCVKAQEPIILLNKRQPAESHLAVLAESLRHMPVDTVYLRPAVRKALEDVWASKPLPGDAEPFQMPV